MRCAGNMHSSYYKWNMAIICNPPIMLCATFVPCFFIFCKEYKYMFLNILFVSRESIVLGKIHTYHKGVIITCISSQNVRNCIFAYVGNKSITRLGFSTFFLPLSKYWYMLKYKINPVRMCMNKNVYD